MGTSIGVGMTILAVLPVHDPFAGCSNVRPPKPESCCRQPLFLPVTYVSKIENERFDFGDSPSEDLIRKIAAALEADEHELLTLPERIQKRSEKRILEHPEVLRKIAQLDDETLNNMLKDLDK